MPKTVVGLLNSSAEAQAVVHELVTSCGCDHAEIGFMAPEAARTEGTERRGPTSGGTLGTAAGPNEVRGDEAMSEGALRGAGAGTAVGGVVGLVAGVTALTIPGLGPLIAAGPIAALLAGATAGAVAGGLIGALVKMGVPEDRAHYYAEGVKRGGTLITVHAQSEAIANCATEVMRKHGAADIEERATQWRQEGWSGRFAAPRYQGPERRLRAGAYAGPERRVAHL